MTYQDMVDLLAKVGVPFAFHHWEQPPLPPYGVYFDSGTNNFPADNIAYHVCRDFVLELYLSQRDEAVEGALERVLTDAGFYWEKETAYVAELRQYQISYEVEV